MKDQILNTWNHELYGYDIVDTFTSNPGPSRIYVHLSMDPGPSGCRGGGASIRRAELRGVPAVVRATYMYTGHLHPRGCSAPRLVDYGGLPGPLGRGRYINGMCN